GCQSASSPPNGTATSRISSTMAANLGAMAKNAVTGVGAPSYTSGVHIWNGTAAILKVIPAKIITIPNVTMTGATGTATAPAAAEITSNCNDPVNPYSKEMPNKIS